MDFYNRKKKLGDILMDAGVINEEQLTLALAEQKIKKQKLGVTLIDMGITTEKEIASALHRQLGYDMVSLLGLSIDEKVCKLVNEQILRKNMMLPFEFKADNPSILRVAMADPLDMMAMDDIEIATGLQIEPVIATPSEIAASIDRYFGNAEARAVAERYTKEMEETVEVEDTHNRVGIDNSPIVILVKTMIEQAVRLRASDIHIEPMESQIRIRYRVDGMLKEVMRYEMNFLPAIITRIKIIGGMDISEKRKPQDGRLTMIVDRREYDIRVSIMPSIFGEKAVLRIASKRELTKDKKELGFREGELEKFNHILANPHGIILVTGPTGSGKSTTLYTVLNELNREEVNIITVEDPVEANMEGICQVQVNTKAGLTFASALRSILRQDPDIIMIGEIRDTETAQIAVQASITGHLVVSTLHTNDAASTFSRLQDMGVEPYLLADASVGVIAQRLVRKLCSCKKARLTNQSENELLGLAPEASQMIFEPNGCQLCNGTGYMGRIGVFEIMPVTDAIKEIISKRGNTNQIKEVAIKEGMSTLKMNAAKYVLDGTTSISEMMRIAFHENGNKE
ncbi:MAG: Flp pilus assembly complex ATPase component TadA [Clostridiales bacterium]|nr:Flp pilus assembly complex ATPase component TadA [Clostridiales bacterium]